jgi:tetratricopeptide (TPR) repeat protein
LAFAQIQLSQFKEAAKTFSDALAKAQSAKNIYLQFQTCEGLGSTLHQMGRFGEATTYYKRALKVLDLIRDDTGMARERVMEKLSQASEALQESHKAKRERGPSLSSDEDVRSKTPTTRHPNHRQSPPSEEVHRNFRESVFGEVLEDNSNPTNHQPQLPTAPNKVSLTERRGAKALPPIKTKQPETQPPSHKHVVLQGKERLASHTDTEYEDNEYSDKLKAYVDSYRDSEDASQDSWTQELDTVNFDKELQNTTPRARGSHSVREGSLAIGPNARLNFTVQTTEEWGKDKKGKDVRRRKSEIIPTSPTSSSLSTDSSTTPTHHAAPATRNQSRVCTIL